MSNGWERELERKMTKPVRRILIYRMGSLGDTMVALPCFHLLARLYPQAERRLLTNHPVQSKAPPSAAVLGESGLVQGYFRHRVGERSPLALLQRIAEIRNYGPDMLVYIPPVQNRRSIRRDIFFFRHLCGINRIVGAADRMSLMRDFDAQSGAYRHRQDSSTGWLEAEAERLARMLSILGDARPRDLTNWDLRLTAAERRTASEAMRSCPARPLIVCAPGTKSSAKDWGKENWRWLLERLYRRYPAYGLVMVGAAEEREVCAYAASLWKGASLNLCGQLTPRETAAVLRDAAVFLGPDSGPMHLAASVGVRCVIAFSARFYPGAWFPVGQQHEIHYHPTECRGCRLDICHEQQRRCLTAITVDAMEASVQRVLSKSAAPREPSS